MKWNSLSVPKWSSFVTFVITTAIFGFSCGSGNSPTPVTPVFPQANFVDTVCGDAIFGLGRPVSMSALSSVGAMGFALREVHFRNVVLRNSNQIEFAYRTKLVMEEKMPSDPRRRYLEPHFSVACEKRENPSPRARRLTRSTIPIVSDLHLPSLRITASNEPYSIPRIGEMTVALDDRYYSFNNQNWSRYANIRTVSQYMEILKYRGLFDVVELREMADGWIGIVAEKYSGIERSQLVILLSRSY